MTVQAGLHVHKGVINLTPLSPAVCLLLLQYSTGNGVTVMNGGTGRMQCILGFSKPLTGNYQHYCNDHAVQQ